MNANASLVIDALGGTAKVAGIFEISKPSVSNWRKNGIPKPHMRFLRASFAAVLDGFDLDTAEARGRTVPDLAKEPACSQ